MIVQGKASVAVKKGELTQVLHYNCGITRKMFHVKQSRINLFAATHFLLAALQHYLYIQIVRG